MKRVFDWILFILFGVGNLAEEARKAGIIK